MHLTQKELLERYYLSRTTLYRLMDSEGFPKPVTLGFRKRGWLQSEVNAWLANRPALVKDRKA
jgi:prophage regulatory protein